MDYRFFANAFIYFVRYGVLDWAPMYLEQVKHMDLANSSWSYFAFEIAGIFGTILCGWLSDKVFKRPSCSGYYYLYVAGHAGGLCLLE